MLARFNLRRAAKAVWRLERDDPDAYAELVRRTGLDRDEPIEWSECSDAMYIPYDEYLGIHPQDAHFLEREMWDLENTPLEKRPLLLHYHPLVIYRFQVLKQADVVLALFLQGEEFSAEQKRADFDYYDPITTGDSTLSAVVQSIIAAEVGYADLALRYFLAALFVDLDDRHNNTADGVHVASTGGVWSALVSGFGGFRDNGADNGDEQWQIDPRLPASWDSLVYRITLHGTRVRVTVRADELELYVEDGHRPAHLRRARRAGRGEGGSAGRRTAGAPGPDARGRAAQPGGHPACRRHGDLRDRADRRRRLGPVTCPLPCSSWVRPVDAEVLGLLELPDAVAGALAAETALLHAAERRRRVGDQAAVDADHAGLDALARAACARWSSPA